ncbi:MAG: thiol reductant ABC exporter subunit CydD [Devosia sp.]
MAEPAEMGRWLSGLAQRRRGLLAAVVALPTAAGILLLAQAWVLADVLQRAVVEGATPTLLWPSAALLATILGVRIALSVVGEMLAVRLSESVKSNLRGSMFRDLLQRAPVWTAGRSSGALSSVLIEQVEALDGFFARYLPAMVQATLLPLAFAIVIFPVDWVVAVLFLVTAPLIPVFMALAGWGAEAASRRQATALNRLSGRFADRLRGLTTLKLFGAAEREVAGVRTASEELRVRTMRVMRIAFLSSAVLEFFAALGVAGVALYVGLTFLDLVSLRGGAELTLAAGLFCLLMAPEVYQPLRLLAAHYHDRAAAKAAAAEIAEELGALPQPEIPAVARMTPSAGQRGVATAAKLDVAGLSMLSPGGQPVLERVDLSIAPGEHVAILGASGIGKSTLLEAIAGLRPFAGSIRIDDVPLADIAEPTLRQRLAVLGQRPRVLAGSIAENIGLGRAGACHAALRRAAHRAHVTDFADQLPQGFATRLGEDGIGLSGGEIQRIALARVYLRDPGLILLDEPTAHLDAATEAAVLDELLAFATGRSLLVVTHSHAVAARMDKVFRIVGGRLLPAPKPVVTRSKAGAA